MRFKFLITLILFIGCISDDKENDFPRIRLGKYVSLLNCGTPDTPINVKIDANFQKEYFTLTGYINNNLTSTETGPWHQTETELIAFNDTLTIRNVAVNAFEMLIDDPEVVAMCNAVWMTFIKQ